MHTYIRLRSRNFIVEKKIIQTESSEQYKILRPEEDQAIITALSRHSDWGSHELVAIYAYINTHKDKDIYIYSYKNPKSLNN